MKLAGNDGALVEKTQEKNQQRPPLTTRDCLTSKKLIRPERET